MKRILILFASLLMTRTLALSFTLPPVPTDLPPQVIQDSKSKISYYLESDRRHVAAIDSDGKLKWCVELIDAKFRSRCYVTNIAFDKDTDKIYFTIWETGYGSGTIEKLTGKVWHDPTVQ